jgi:hypothetical protein
MLIACRGILSTNRVSQWAVVGTQLVVLHLAETASSSRVSMGQQMWRTLVGAAHACEQQQQLS